MLDSPLWNKKRNNKPYKKQQDWRWRKKTLPIYFPSSFKPISDLTFFSSALPTHFSPDGSSPFPPVLQSTQYSLLDRNCYSHFLLHFLGAGIFSVFLFPFLLMSGLSLSLPRSTTHKTFNYQGLCWSPEGRQYQCFIHKNQLTVMNWLYTDCLYPFKSLRQNFFFLLLCNHFSRQGPEIY